MAATIQPVILSGGAGTRLWPASRELYPKQFLKLVSGRSVLQETALRVADRTRYLPPIIVAAEEHRFLVEEQLGEAGIADARIVLEPVARNTAPAVAAAAFLAAPGAVLLVLPSDHAIRDLAAFHRAVAAGAEAARKGHLVAFGVKAATAETGYGYIRRGRRLAGTKAYAVARFVEKPKLPRARAMLKEGGWLWNAGMFAFAPQRYLDELRKRAPTIAAAAWRAVDRTRAEQSFLYLGRAAFVKSPSQSIDRAIMEKTRSAAVVPVAMGWSDLGSWDTLWRALPHDKRGNAVRGDALLRDVTDSYVSAEGQLIAVLGLKDVAVVGTPDAVLVAARGSGADMHEIVAQLKALGREEHRSPLEVRRPWGSYISVDAAPGVQVKRITVKPGAALSLQMHHKRAEHWIVVRGLARVTRDEKVFDLKAGEATYIPLGAKHRLENPGAEPLHLIEVQVGDYLGEDDIVRFDDRYGRVEKK